MFLLGGAVFRGPMLVEVLGRVELAERVQLLLLVGQVPVVVGSVFCHKNLRAPVVWVWVSCFVRHRRFSQRRAARWGS